MRILLVHNFYRSGAPGGEDVVFLQEKKLLQNRGHEVVAYTRSNDEVNLRSPRQVFTVATQLSGSRKAATDLRSLIRDFRPDVAHFHNTFPLIGVESCALVAAGGVPVVQTVHNYRLRCAAATHFRAGRVCELCTTERPWSAVKHRCYADSVLASWAVAKMIRNNARAGVYGHAIARFIALTRFAERQLVISGVPLSRIVVRPNCLDVDVSGARLAKDRYAVFSGRLSLEKGVPLLLELWRDLPSLPLKVVGSGPLFLWARQRAVEQGLNIEFLGKLPREQALEVVARAAVLIAPSQWFEGMPLVILEAWALGVPVVASDIGGIAEMLGASERGIVCRPDEAKDFLEGVKRVIENRTLAGTLAAAGREHFLRHHTPVHGIESLEQIYRSVIAEVKQGRGLDGNAA